jgi:hypothetical protein
MLLLNFYIFGLALILAILEIQIEGEHGWAKKLPTWRPHKKSWIARAYAKVMSDRELTGFHATLFPFVLLVFGLPYAYGLPLTAGNIAQSLSIFFIFLILWDFLWFVLNPHYPLSKFKKEHIWWHKKWALGAPADYYFAIFVSFLIALFAETLLAQKGMVQWWAWNMCVFGIETLVLIFISLNVLDIDNWNSRKKA